MITASREHTISCGHRVVGHESKCRYLHGHNYTVITTISCPQLDEVGRVLDFGVMKALFAEWLEMNWDHKMLLWTQDSLLSVPALRNAESDWGIVRVPFNPTAEHMARYLLDNVFPQLLAQDNHSDIHLSRVRVVETPKCWADATPEP